MYREGVLLLQEGMFLAGAGEVVAGHQLSAQQSSWRAGPCGLGTQPVPNVCLWNSIVLIRQGAFIE